MQRGTGLTSDLPGVVKTQAETSTPPLHITGNAQRNMFFKKERISGQVGDASDQLLQPEPSDGIGESQGIPRSRNCGGGTRSNQPRLETPLVPGELLKSDLGHAHHGPENPLYQERDATELYHELSLISQGKNETPQGYVMRALDLRQRIIRASADATESLHYDDALVQKSMGQHSETIPPPPLRDNLKCFFLIR